MMPQSPSVTTIVDRLFCSRTSRYGPYHRNGDPQEILPNILYRYNVTDRSGTSATLQIFSGLGELGGQLWEQEVRVLLRISAINHPALPRIIDGSYDESDDIAFVVTEAARRTLDINYQNALGYLRKRCEECVHHLGLLADALATLHGQGLMHRNIWPGSIDYVEEDHSSWKLRLARFEMSALIGNILRRVTPDVHQDDERVRLLFKNQGNCALAYFPPERIAFMFPGSRSDMLETDRSDVYGLGVIAFEWFVGDLPKRHIRSLSHNNEQSPHAVDAINAHMLRQITLSKLPGRFRDLLRGMIDPDPRTRLTSSQVVDMIARDYDALVALWESANIDKPYLVAFMPTESGQTVYSWGWIDHDPSDPEGKLELAEFLESELRGAEIIYSSDGAEPYIGGGDPEAKRNARYVLQGRLASWFCTYYEDRQFGQTIDIFEEVLLIKYVASRDRTRRLDALTFRRRVSCIEAVDWQRRDLPDVRNERPTWKPVFESMENTPPNPPYHTKFERAFDWLLDLQEVELLARQYPFVLCNSDTPELHGEICIRWDRDRDAQHIVRHRTTLFAHFASSEDRRPSFGDFFDDPRVRRSYS